MINGSFKSMHLRMNHLNAFVSYCVVKGEIGIVKTQIPVHKSIIDSIPKVYKRKNCHFQTFLKKLPPKSNQQCGFGVEVWKQFWIIKYPVQEINK